MPIVLHLLKREPEPRVKFAAVALLRAARRWNATATRRLREILLLVLRVSALLLLALAFARPFFAFPCSRRGLAQRDGRPARHFLQHVVARAGSLARSSSHGTP